MVLESSDTHGRSHGWVVAAGINVIACPNFGHFMRIDPEMDPQKDGDTPTKMRILKIGKLSSVSNTTDGVGTQIFDKIPKKLARGPALWGLRADS